MYRYRDDTYGYYKTEHEAKQLYLALPEDFDMLRKSFEESFRSEPEKMFDRLIDNEKYKEGEDTELKCFVEIGWHTPFEFFFEATGMTPIEEDLILDRKSYFALISSMLSAKYGEPIGLNYNKLIQFAHNLIDHYPRFYNIFKSICFYYGHYEELRNQDSNDKLKKKEKMHRIRISKPNHGFNKIFEFLCPKLNGRLLYANEHGVKAADQDLVHYFNSVKFFSMLLDPASEKLDESYIEENVVESFDLIKKYLKSRDYQSKYYTLECANKVHTSKISDFIFNTYNISGEKLNLHARDGSIEYENELSNFAKLLILYELDEYIVDGLYDHNSNCLSLNHDFKQLDSLEIYEVKRKIKNILDYTITQYMFDDAVGHGCVGYSG